MLRIVTCYNVAEWAEGGPGLQPNLRDRFGYLEALRAAVALPPGTAARANQLFELGRELSAGRVRHGFCVLHSRRRRLQPSRAVGIMMQPFSRRKFLATGALGGAGWLACRTGLAQTAPPVAPAGAFGSYTQELLVEWGVALLKLQCTDVSKPEEFGAFRCPACGVLHGRCGDATLPLLYLAQLTQRQAFLDGALRVRTWMQNVESPDGAWLNDPGAAVPWKGTTVFGAIALAESLHYHSALVAPAMREAWHVRLRKAAKFITDNFHWNNYANVNYPVTAAYALALSGRVLGDSTLVERGRLYAMRALEFLTKPSRLLYGEGKPYEFRSPKNCVPVDLGYNVEESLPALVQYALLTDEQDVLFPVLRALKAHLEFMLPDGGWDDSWGTRSYKWTWWGSRTTSGSTLAYALLAKRVPEFAAATVIHLKQLRACTHDGLLHGGPHHHAHGLPPCVQHTFCHAKGLAALLDHPQFDPNMAVTALPPRVTAQGLKYFPEIQVWLAAIGPWRATVSGYDWFNAKPQQATVQATGGALGVAWHGRVGAVLCASLAAYEAWEPQNMEKLAGPDFPLTPRLERLEQGVRYANIFDGGATVKALAGPGAIVFMVQAQLLASALGRPPADAAKCKLEYQFTPQGLQIETQCAGPHRLMLPLIALQTERAVQPDAKTLTIARAGGTVRLESATPLEVEGQRVYNPVPGFEALPVAVTPDASGRCRVMIRVT